MNANQESLPTASIESDPKLRDRVCHFWRSARPCERQKWLLGCAFGMAFAPNVERKQQVAELKFLSRLAGFQGKDVRCQETCTRKRCEAAVKPSFVLSPA